MRRLGWLLPVLLSALLLTACGDEADPQEAVVDAADATIEAGSTRIGGHAVIHGEEDVRTSVEGVYDFDRRVGSFDTSIQGSPTSSVLDGDHLYAKAPGLVEEVGTHWLGADLDDVGDDVPAELFSLALDAATSDPSLMVGYLRGAVDVRERGAAKVRGATTTRYHARLDLDAAADAAPAAQRPAMRRAARLLGVDEQPADIWLDDEGRVRRLVETFDYSEMGLPDGIDADQLAATATVTYDYYDFGTEVDVDVPDADDVTDAADLVAQPPVVAKPEHLALERRLLTDVPPGFEQQPDDVGDTGPSDLAKATRDAGYDDAEDELTEDGFVAGYQRLWQDDEADQVIVFLYEFATPEGAQAHAEKTWLVEQSQMEDGNTSTFSVEGIDGAHGTAYRNDDEGFVSHVVDFRSGVYVVRVVTSGIPSSPELVTGLARQQLQRLQ